MRNVCKNVSPRPTDLFCRFCLNDSVCLLYGYGSLLLPATTTQLSSQNLSSDILCSRFEFLSSTNKLCTFCRSKLQLIILQRGRYNYAKKEMQLSQYLVQVRSNPVHVVDQYLYRMESLLLLKQPFCNVF